jgi:putative PIN family toxin of toxin-antitoxin system
MRAVFDTNVLISALIAPGGKPSRTLKLAIRDRFELFLSRPILEELVDVLARPFFRRRLGDPGIARAYVALLAASFPLAPIGTGLISAVHPEDRHVVAAAIGCGADYLVTGDRQHLLPLGRAGKAEIVSVNAFLDAIEKSPGHRID